jgi:hypothetical protein
MLIFSLSYEAMGQKSKRPQGIGWTVQYILLCSVFIKLLAVRVDPLNHQQNRKGPSKRKGHFHILLMVTAAL